MTDSDDESRHTIDESALIKQGFNVSMPENKPIGNSIVVTANTSFA